MRVAGWRWAIVGVAAVTVVSLQGTARASEGADGSITLQADAGIDGWVAVGHAYPVVVKVTTEQLIQGTVRVELNRVTGTTILEREIELAGGNTGTYRLLAPAEVSQWGMGPLAADPTPSTVSLVVDGKAVATVQMDSRFDSTAEVVGVLPDARAAFGEGAELPGSVPLLVDVGVARPVAVDTELLDLGALALEPLDQLVALPSELNDLPKASRQAVVSWVDAGGVLLLAGDVAVLPDNLLPEGWVPPAGGGVRAGLGRVRAVSASWQDEILPSATRSSSEENQISETMLQAQDSVTGRLSQDAGVRLPPGGRLGVLLALYVLVIGPLAFMALRRFGRRSGAAAVDDDEPPVAQVRRPLVAWAAIPVVAVLSTGAVVGAGGSLRRTASSAHVTIYEVGPGGATATTWSLLSNPNRKGAVGVELPEGWTASTATSAWEQQESPVHVSTTDDGLEATTTPPAGGFGVVRSSGPAADMADALEVTADSVADDVIRGTVRNKLDVPLEDVAVLVGRAAVADLGTLQPGEEREFEVERASQYAFQADPERRVWPDNAGSMNGDVWIGRGGDGGGVIVQKLPAAGAFEVTAEREAAASELQDAAAAADPAQAPPPVTTPPEPPGDAGEVKIEVPDDGVIVDRGGVPGNSEQPAPPAPPPVVLPAPGGKPVFPDGPDVGGEADEGPTMMAAWADLMQQRGWNYRPTGQVVVVGWTDELAPPVSPSASGKVARSRSAVVARATAAAAGDHVTDAAIVRSTVRGPDVNAGFDEEGFPAMVSFDVPAAVDGRPVDPSRLMFHLWGSYTSAEVWTPNGWVGLPEVPNGQFAEVALPEGALVAGQVFVRWTHPLEVPAPGREFVLYEKET